MAVAETTSDRPRAARLAMPAAGASTLGDKVFFALTYSFAAFVLLILAGILLSLAIGSWPALAKLGFGFFTSTSWNPVTEKFGAVAPEHQRGALVAGVFDRGLDSGRDE